MSVVFVHTADWHLGKEYQGWGPKTSLFARWRFEAVRRTYDLAMREEAQFILVAGDVFHTETPRKEVTDEVLTLFRDAPVPVFVIPGNHDPARIGSIWYDAAFRKALDRYPLVRFFDTPEEVAIESAPVTLFACPVRHKQSAEDTTAWIGSGKRGGERVRIGLAHGVWQRYDGREHTENVIDARRANLAGLDYLALGDLHSYTPDDHPAAKVRTRYSGTCEFMAADEQRPGHALVVRIAGPGAEPQVTPVFVGSIKPFTLGPLTVSPGTEWGVFEAQLPPSQEWSQTLLTLHIQGTLTQAELDAFQAWCAQLETQFLGLDMEYVRVFAEPTPEDFAALHLNPIEQRVLECLLHPDRNTRGEDEVLDALIEDPEARREALALFYRKLREGEVRP